MSANRLSPPPLKVPVLDGPMASTGWAAWFADLFTRVGGATDKIEAAHAAAMAAAPATAEVVALGGLHGGGAVGGNTALSLYVALASVATLPATAMEGDFAYALDGRRVGQTTGNGTGVPCWFSGGAWYAIDSGLAVAA